MREQSARYGDSFLSLAFYTFASVCKFSILYISNGTYKGNLSDIKSFKGLPSYPLFSSLSCLIADDTVRRN